MPAPKPYRLRALLRAKKFVGVKERPAGSNRGPLVTIDHITGGIDVWCRRANGLVGYPWCAAFVCAMFGDIGYPISYPKRASVGFLMAWAAEQGFEVARPLRGDLICYHFDSDNWLDHIGFVDRVLAVRWRGKAFAGYIRTVEGNTASGNDANGGQVQIRYRWVSRCRFIRIPGPGVV